ncbi:hypothetical protein GDO81_022910 [Engystomops pustulosus]|uniref:BPTI/Kunitz inhibitor domain-containing protein n=3 Tax=Engystomops pustulosus TaxID=76066 RepID=A0AAV6YTR5_ENGPU|nr:hypothetical protein GDO81_022910 [Engystomops pustulosus]
MKLYLCLLPPLLLLLTVTPVLSEDPVPNRRSQRAAGNDVENESTNDISYKNIGSAACHLPIVRGSCKALVPRWAYDAAQGRCINFEYSGCQGNGNNFYSEKECKAHCKW